MRISLDMGFKILFPPADMVFFLSLQKINKKINNPENQFSHATDGTENSQLL
jgi:hypothetical protein